MFQWDKTINTIDIPAAKVVHLFRSMREVQLALPGVSAQQASSFLCQYQEGDGIATVAVFHLHKSKVLSFYYSDPRIVPEQKVDSMLDQGLNFVESMGFLMTDQDIHLLDADDQEMLWASLPMKSGLQEDEEPVAVEVTAPKAEMKHATEAKVAPDKSVKEEADKNKTVVAEKQKPTKVDAINKHAKEETTAKASEEVKPGGKPESEPVDNVDDLLAAVEAMRAKRPGLRARKSVLSAEEMEKRRLLLRETIGRIWASL